METTATSRSVNPREAGGHAVRGFDPASSLLLTDLYELNMMQAYLEAGMTEPAVFEFFVRKLPEARGFLMAAGLEQAVDFLENARFTEGELRWLAGSGRFSRRLLDQVRELVEKGIDVHVALPALQGRFIDSWRASGSGAS